MQNKRFLQFGLALYLPVYFLLTVCQKDSPIELAPGQTERFNFQPPVTFPGGIFSCLWQITAPVGYRVYATIISFESDVPGSLYFGSDHPDSPYGGPGLSYASYLQSYLDVVSNNTLWMGLLAQAPFDDDTFVVSFNPTTNTGTCKCCCLSAI